VPAAEARSAAAIPGKGEAQMIERLDHVVIAVRDLDAAVACYRAALGFDARPGGRHPGRGTHNAIVRFGLEYLELLALDDSAQGRELAPNPLVDFLDEHEGGLVGYALATGDIDAVAARLRDAELEADGPFRMERLRPDGSRLAWRLLVPGGVAYRRPWPFFIQWDAPDAERLALESPGAHPNGTTAIEELALVVKDLERAIELYGLHLGLSLASRGLNPQLDAESAVFTLGDVRIEVLAPAGPGVVAEALAAGGEGLFHVVLTTPRREETHRWLEAHGASAAAAPGVPDGLLVDPSRALGARLVVRGPA
jgi:catechol 2,3-dioxygenase-like lactoylglutathione lyase family enzyme